MQEVEKNRSICFFSRIEKSLNLKNVGVESKRVHVPNSEYVKFEKNKGKQKKRGSRKKPKYKTLGIRQRGNIDRLGLGLQSHARVADSTTEFSILHVLQYRSTGTPYYKLYV